MDEQSARAMAAAMQWVARILAVALLMAAPPAAGTFLDRRWQTSWLTPVGVALGLIAGIGYLVAITRNGDRDKKEKE